MFSNEAVTLFTQWFETWNLIINYFPHEDKYLRCKQVFNLTINIIRATVYWKSQLNVPKTTNSGSVEIHLCELWKYQSIQVRKGFVRWNNVDDDKLQLCKLRIYFGKYFMLGDNSNKKYLVFNWQNISLNYIIDGALSYTTLIYISP